MEGMGLNNGFERLKEDAKKVVAGVAVVASMGSSATAQGISHENPEHGQSTEIKLNSEESDVALLKQITSLEKHWESFSETGQVITNPKSFTIISRSEIEKSLNPFSSPLNDRYIAGDIITDLSDNYKIINRGIASQQAFDSEHLLATEGFSKGSHYEYSKPAYYFVIEQEAIADGTTEFIAKMISLNDNKSEVIASVKTDNTVDTSEKEKFFDDTIIPILRAGIAEKIQELGLEN